jgi:hypothetical protein
VDLSTGALNINGSFGGRGQLLVSNGGAQPAAWSFGPMYKKYLTDIERLTNAALTINTTNLTSIPLLDYAPELTVSTKMRVFYNLAVDAPGCAFCSFTDFQVSVVVNNVVLATYQHSIENGASDTFTGSFLLTLNAGTPVISIRIKKLSGPDLVLPISGTRRSSMVIESTPQF